MLKAVSASKFVRKLIFSSALVVLLPISTSGQPLPDSARFNQNTRVLSDFGLDSAADLENIGNSVEPIPELRPKNQISRLLVLRPCSESTCL